MGLFESSIYNYGNCPCTGHYENRTVEVRMTMNDQQVIIRDVPQGVCPLCGLRVYKVNILEYIESVFKSDKRFIPQE
jgi:YgiT-type zinc finger domain-containing protein